MIFLRTLVLSIWLPLTVLISLFSVWRKLRLERVTDEDQIIDKLLIGSIIGVLAGRLGYILLHFSQFGLNLGNWLSLSRIPGTVEVVALVVMLFSFWKLLGKNWRDTIEIVDYTSITIALYLFLGSLLNVVLQLVAFISAMSVGTAQLLPKLDIQAVLVSLIYTVFYFVLYLFLGRMEKVYRTFMWYRARRRSAQTGFIVAVFCIGYGISGFVLDWFTPATIAVAGINLDPLLRLLVMVGGFVILYLRSGHSFFNKS